MTTRNRSGLAAALTVMSVLVPATGVAAPAAAQAPAACDVTYQATSWTEQPAAGGFVAHLTITNLGEPIAGWELAFTLPPGQSVRSGWSAGWPPTGTTGGITATSLPWNGDLDTGESTEIGLYGRWSGEFTEPEAFLLNGTPCVGDRQPPEVTVGLPPLVNGNLILWRVVTLTADATSATGAIDRVEFYLGDGLFAGADTTAPYCVHVDAQGFIILDIDTAYATAIDDGDPPLSADSEPVTFGWISVPLPKPAHIIPSPSVLEVHAGGSATLNVRLSVETTAEVEMVVTGEAGLTVTPASFTLDPGNWDTGQDVTVTAPPGAEGLRAHVTAQVADPDISGEGVPAIVVGADPTDTCGQV